MKPDGVETRQVPDIEGRYRKRNVTLASLPSNLGNMTSANMDNWRDSSDQSRQANEVGSYSSSYDLHLLAGRNSPTINAEEGIGGAEPVPSEIRTGRECIYTPGPEWDR